MKYDPKLIQFCKTDLQINYFKSILELKSFKLVAKKFNVNESTIRRLYHTVEAYAASRGYSPSNDMNKTVPENYFVNGTTTLYNNKGKKVLQWVKSTIDKDKLDELHREILDQLFNDIPRIDLIERSNINYENKLAIYPISDLHLGMFAWKSETGKDYDLKLAENNLMNAMKNLITQTPRCKECIISNLGDLFHSDNLKNMTERSGNVLDIDTRYPKIFALGVKLIRNIIAIAAQTHEKVTVINSIGNHDDLSSMVLTIALKNIYENCENVNIIDSPTQRHYFKFGNSLLGFTHGSDCKLEDLPLIMATERSEDWGTSKYRYIYTGHFHKDGKVELGNTLVETFRSFASRDAWSASKGFCSGNDAKCIIIDPEFGEVQRSIYNFDRI